MIQGDLILLKMMSKLIVMLLPNKDHLSLLRLMMQSSVEFMVMGSCPQIMKFNLMLKILSQR